MSCFILDKKQPLPLPSPRESVIELRVNEVLFKIMGHYLFPITYGRKMKIRFFLSSQKSYLYFNK